MHKPYMLFFKVLFLRLPPKKQEALQLHLNKTILTTIQQLPSSFYKNPINPLFSAGDYLDNINATWITFYLRNFSENDIRLFAASLSEAKRNEVREILLFSNHSPPLKKEAKKFLQDRLFAKIKNKKKDLLPIECLPEHPLNTLLELTSEQLLELINCLGLMDVAHDLKHIIDTVKRKQIQGALSQKNQNFLKFISHQKESIAFKRMGLETWDGDLNYLNKLIHQRGLNRLAKALFGQEESLFWYLSHKLDTSNSSILQQLHTDLKHPKGVLLLIKQIAELKLLIQENKI